MAFSLISYVAVLLGGITLFIAPFTASGRLAPHWIRVALWLLCPISIAWSLLGLTILYYSAALSDRALGLVYHYKALCAGKAVGILALLLLSGEFMRLRRHKKVEDTDIIS
jgi:hypothetical protein